MLWKVRDTLLAVREINKKEASLSEWLGLKDIHFFFLPIVVIEVVTFQHANRGLIR